MKKIVIPIALILTSAIASAASYSNTATNDAVSPFSGISVSGNLGVASLSQKRTVDYQVAGNRGNDSRTHGALGFAAQVIAGYNYFFTPKFTLGLNANYLYNDAQIKASGTGIAEPGDIPVHYSQKSTLNHLVGVNAQIGYALNKNALIYLNIGPAWGWFKTTSSNSFAGSHTFSDHQTGLNIAIGSKQALCGSRWFIQEKVGVVTFGNKTISQVGNDNVKRKTELLSGLLGVGYSFDV